jgi:predicted DNA-binding transcriptional regulator YafY
MPAKKATYASYGQKLIGLFVKLLVTEQRHSLTELAQMFRCSKQTILRYVSDIRRAYGVDIEETLQGNRKYYRIKKLRRNFPVMALSESDLMLLQMCRAFSEHLLGQALFQEAAHALEKSTALMLNRQPLSFQHFADLRPGTIDYTPHQAAMQALMFAMDKRRVCKIIYKKIMAVRAKTLFVKPLKLFSHKDTVYLNARLAKAPGKKYAEPDFDPLLAVHRIQKVAVTERTYEYPDDYHFDRVYNRHFGVIRDKAFTVEVEFSGWAAAYVTERIWSPDQRINRRRDGSARLTFSASSEPELTSWLLSFGDKARLIRPAWLIEKIRANLASSLKHYPDGSYGAGAK